jgi:cytochrome bd-type quinol oxidase subunit 2
VAFPLKLAGTSKIACGKGFGISFLYFPIVFWPSLFGAAAGNVARGVPVDADGNFSMACFTNFSVRGQVGLLDWYTMGLLTTGGAAIFPVMLYSTLTPENSMTAYAAAAGEQSLRLASLW